MLATIARVEGSSYRREGARLLVEPDGRLTGVLSGGCLERDIVALADETLAGGRAAHVQVYDLTADEEAIWGTGTGCAGQVTLLLEPLDAPRRQAEIATPRDRPRVAPRAARRDALPTRRQRQRGRFARAAIESSFP